MLEVDQAEQHTSPRDDSTMSMFGESSPNKPAKSYRVLARKYRPQLFSDLIGQEAMVRTLENAFRSGRIAHAFMLTGVRGVGKTTTARLLARGLNYVTDTVKQPSTVLDPMGEHCQAIMDSSHPDILELDAASRTGVADMRDLLDGVRYSSVSARYKVYIIDEVHMLSIAAFNALLKTLEEPPEHVKFIFATTEIRKVPVTVLSRCQRFDLKRLDIDVLKTHLALIATKEGASVEEEGLTLIARAAEGSVRDALSILDQAIVQSESGQPVSSESIRDMIGLGDRNRVLDVFEQITQGDGGTAIKNVADQIVSGADPLVLLKDLLEICADIATAQAIGGTNLVGAESWVTRVNSLAQKLSPAQTALIWQMLLTGYQSAQLAPSTDTAVKMVILRIATSAKLPSPEQAAKMLANGGEQRKEESPQVETPASVKPKVQQPIAQKDVSERQIQPSKENDIATSIQTMKEPTIVQPLKEPVTFKKEPDPLIEPKTVDEIVKLMLKEKQLTLSGDFRQYIQIREFEVGKIVCSVKDGAPDGLISKVSDFLNDKINTHWSVQTVDISSNSGETIRERDKRLKNEQLEKAKKDPNVIGLLDVLPDANVIDVES